MTYVLCTTCLSKLRPPTGSACLSIVPGTVVCEACGNAVATSEFNGSLVDLLIRRGQEALEAGYKTYAGIEFGSPTYGVRIQVTGDIQVDKEASDELSDLLAKAVRVVQTSMYRNNPAAKEDGEQRVKGLIACFDGHLCHVYERLPNQYSDAPHNYYNPWLVMITLAGPITIGWRKRVIEIRWTDAKRITRESVDLFQGEDTTRFEKVIHAWGYPKAKEYINKLLTEGVWTAKQRELKEKHGTPQEFAAIVRNAIGELSVDEAQAAIDKYEREWREAGNL